MADLTLVTRGSPLALWQTNWVADRLRASHPGLTIELRTLSTQGDRVTDRPLPAIGGKGLFTAELEEALLSGAADLAVHSLKDLPTDLPEGLGLLAVPPREEVRDAVILPAGRSAPEDEQPLRSLPPGALVGTSSLRRRAFLRHHRPDLELSDIRGNVDTRLRKLDEGQYGALVMAAAGLRRLGRAERISELLPLDLSVPAPGQGALAIEGRRGDERVAGLLTELADPLALAAVTAERAFLEALGGGCQIPLGAYAEPAGEGLHLLVAVADREGTQLLRAAAVGGVADPAALGRSLAASLLADGADRLLAG